MTTEEGTAKKTLCVHPAPRTSTNSHRGADITHGNRTVDGGRVQAAQNLLIQQLFDRALGRLRYARHRSVRGAQPKVLPAPLVAEAGRQQAHALRD